MQELNVPAILGYGISGPGFLLAVPTAEPWRERPRSSTPSCFADVSAVRKQMIVQKSGRIPPRIQGAQTGAYWNW